MNWEEFKAVLISVKGDASYNEEQKILEDCGIDSFQMMEIICELESQGISFDFSIDNEIKTLGDLFNRMTKNHL